MIIREATEQDIPEIVQVLKASLGEEDLLLSEEVWRYKHIDNPFGRSIVLLAEENEQIVGVRAFMRWKWCINEKEYSALRAVDTATHPDHQGKGIFKKLTLKAVELAKESGEDFIFNTPNEKSRPGYLKMGWQPVDKIKVGLKPSFYGFWRISKSMNYAVKKRSSDQKLRLLCEQWNSKLQTGGGLFTPKSVDFLTWRYQLNPLQKYEVLITEQFYLAVYIKKRKGIKELRITELLCASNEKKFREEIGEAIKQLEKKFGSHFISFSPDLYKAGTVTFCGNYGPVLTLRNLNLLEQKEKALLQIENWKPSLGDLELF